MWKTLGIAKTKDAKAIRRAYAARLRALGNDPSAADFQALRSAFERALAQAAAPEPVEGAAPAMMPVTAFATGDDDEYYDDDEDDGPAIVEDEDAAPVEGEASPSNADTKALYGEINAALSGRRYADAFAAFDRGLATGMLGLGARAPVLDGIMASLLRDDTVSPDDFVAFMHRAGWDVFEGRGPVSGARRAATERLNAELWFRHTQQLAAGTDRRDRRAEAQQKLLARWLDRRSQRAAAREVVGRRRALVLVSTRTEKAFDRLVEEARYYAPWLGPRMDAKRIDSLRGLQHRNDMWGGTARGVFFWVPLIVLLPGALVLMAGTGLPGGALFGVILALRFLYAWWRRSVR